MLIRVGCANRIFRWFREPPQNQLLIAAPGSVLLLPLLFLQCITGSSTTWIFNVNSLYLQPNGILFGWAGLFELIMMRYTRVLIMMTPYDCSCWMCQRTVLLTSRISKESIADIGAGLGSASFNILCNVWLSTTRVCDISSPFICDRMLSYSGGLVGRLQLNC